MYTVRNDIDLTPTDSGSWRRNLLRIAVFLGVFIVFAGGGLIFDYSRPATYRATARVSVEPPGYGDDPAGRAQFVVSEAQALRRSDFMQKVAAKLGTATPGATLDQNELERSLKAEAVPQTTVIELRAEGGDRNALIAALAAWIEVYTESRKDTDRTDEVESLEEARHAAQVARTSVEDKRREMEAFRQRHGISSIERDENPGTARLRGIYTALNDAATREVNAEARLKAMTDSIAQGQGVIRAADKASIASLEMRAVDLREKMKDLEHEYTTQYLALDPKFKALKANLARLEQQTEHEKARSQKTALTEAQEEHVGAQRAVQRIREQADALKQSNQAFSTRFAELRRMATDLEQLQETRRTAVSRLRKLESARKPTSVRVRVLSAPLVGDEPVSPNYSRDAALALGGGMLLAIAAVWLLDFLRREEPRNHPSGSQPIIQIAYPMIQGQQVMSQSTLPAGTPSLLPSAPAPVARELTASDIAALWRCASVDARLVTAACLNGIAPPELTQLRWRDVAVDTKVVHISGARARALALVEPLLSELSERSSAPRQTNLSPDRPLLADGAGGALDEAALDDLLARVAHDAGLRHPEQVTARSLHFTYAAYLARQGIGMVDLAAVTGGFAGGSSAELMHLAPPGQPRPADSIDFVYSGFRGI